MFFSQVRLDVTDWTVHPVRAELRVQLAHQDPLVRMEE